MAEYGREGCVELSSYPEYHTKKVDKNYFLYTHFDQSIDVAHLPTDNEHNCQCAKGYWPKLGIGDVVAGRSAMFEQKTQKKLVLLFYLLW